MRASIAFPAISTGIYGYPLEPATDVAVATVAGADTPIEHVRFVCFDAATLARLRVGPRGALKRRQLARRVERLWSRKSTST